MIKKEIVEYIINENSDCDDNKQNKNDGFDFKWSDKKLKLLDYVSHLSDDEILDLMALMNLGRQMNSGSNNTTFSQERKSINLDCLKGNKKLIIKDELLFNRNMNIYLINAINEMY